MLLLSQAPNGALSARRCTPASPLPPLPRPNPPLFSKCPPALPRRTHPGRKLALALASSTSPEGGAGDPGPSSSGRIASPPSPPPFPGGDETVFVGEEGVPLEGVIQFDRPGPSSRLESWGRVALLAGGDVLFLLVFSAIGRFNHGLPVLDIETFRTADPFIAGWFLGAYFLGGYGDDGKGVNSRSRAALAAAKSWAVGIPIGLVIRGLTSAGHIPPVSFILITMGTTGFLLIGWRALLYTLFPNRQSKKDDVYKRGNPFELFELLASLVRRW
uniref:Uncharacterized protein n=1 Tax=Anthurium amnicola TaxID=1678845 RepID=A0A1D1XT85_9ARAE